MKWTYCIISSLLFSIPTIGHTQRHFTVTVVPEQSIEKSKLECKLIAAETEEDLRYTADSTQLIGQGSTKGGYVFLEISYQIKDRNYSNKHFWIPPGDNFIQLTIDSSHDGSFLSPSKLKLAVDLELTAENKNDLIRSFFDARIAEAMQLGKILNANLTSNQSDWASNIEVSSQYKKLNSVSIDFLQQHRKHPIAFYFFLHQVLQPTMSFLRQDTAYLDSLIKIYKNIFRRPAKGSALVKQVDYQILTYAQPLERTQKAPSITSQTLEGRRINWKKLGGSIVLLDFSASWCIPCVEQLPELKRLDSIYKDRGLKVIMVGIDSNLDSLKTFVNKYNIQWPVIWDPEQKIGKRFHLTSIPLTVLVDKDSKIRIIGSLHELEQEIERINLREQSTY